MSSPLPPKKDVALALLERTSVFVYLDPRREGVVIPMGFKNQHKLVLQVGLNMPVPIRDLKFDDQGMSCTLSFNRTPFFCIVPWTSVFALTGEDAQGLVWPEDVPRELVEAQQQQQRRAALHAVPAAPPSAPTVDEEQTLAAKKPAAEKPAPKKPAAKKAPAEKPAAKKAPAEKPAAKKAPAEKPAAKKAPAEKPAAKKPAAKKPAAGKPAAKKPAAAEKPVVAREPDRAVPVPAAAAAPVPAAAPPPPRVGGKTKRELPPYLRVVK
ncbi:MAG: hypothetical protein IPQ09_18570 [Myxococcales bacterium]|nr:hypothetical protein [Myxococcales bacterium]HQY63038.1 hypothetical protein [Polyangiaceae bacterium]